MKKRERKKLNDKVILFPDLEKRLLEKGLESLQRKKFTEAIDLFEEAMALEPENSEVHIGLILAYFEFGSLQLAKERANNMLQMGIGNYIQIIDIYLMILVQLHQYDEIVTTIEALIEENEIPGEKIEHFTRMLQFSRRMAESIPQKELDPDLSYETENKELNLFTLEDHKEQMLLIAQLADRNIRPYVEEIQTYLQSAEGNLFVKTLLLNILLDQDYDKEVMIRKLDREISVIPANLLPVHEQPQLKILLELLGGQLEHEDPVLLENIKSLIERHFFIIYPFTFETFEESSLAAAYHSLANDYHGISYDIEEIARSYNANENDIIEAGLFLKKIEEISYPNF
ncbi:tetratricopeptide repeat protein [Bacillus sp. FJAT-29790]|uniref:tetratricopeptide repeat protein n=1 Tax=Bacillus sp. FJAT-29790 TaxID=1895002 RepID=UPI001C22CFAC|nr:tetratricopeptide repeat protein [Bacillus sp. FJAT-29790]MBU8879595.1 tetratricopeptide repeat protein [Bacillus sp. FJAT-29790]